MMIRTAPKLQQSEYHRFKNVQKVWPEELHCCIV